MFPPGAIHLDESFSSLKRSGFLLLSVKLKRITMSRISRPITPEGVAEGRRLELLESDFGFEPLLLRDRHDVTA